MTRPTDTGKTEAESYAMNRLRRPPDSNSALRNEPFRVGKVQPKPAKTSTRGRRGTGRGRAG